MSIPAWYRKEIVLGIAFFVLPFIVPTFIVSEDVGSLVTATTAIFALVAGFFIVDATANYLKLQSLIAEEDAALISIADDARQLDVERYAAVHDAIDAYMIAQLDLGTLAHVQQTQGCVDRLDASIHALSASTEKSVLQDHMLTMEEKIMTCRQELALAAQRTLSFVHWFTLIIFAILVVITLLAMRNGALFMNVVAGAMMAGIFALLIVLRDVDNNSLLERKLGYKNSTLVFHAISRPPYYPYFSPIKSRIPDESGRLRVGEKP